MKIQVIFYSMYGHIFRMAEAVAEGAKHGFVIVGVPYSCQELTNMNEITGGSPYGAGTLAGADGSRKPSENELAIARFQGRHVAEITKKLA